MSRYPNRNSTGGRFHLAVFICMTFWVVMLSVPDSSQGQSIPENDREYRLWYSGFDARSSAMANANAADPFDLNGFYSNPAIPVFSNNSASFISNSLYNPGRGIMLENLTFSLGRSTSHHLAAGATIQSSILNEKLYYGPNHMQFTQIDLALGYSWSIFRSLSAGASVQSFYGKTASSEVWTYNASAGLLYVPSSLISYGLVYKGTAITEGRMGAKPVYILTEENETVVAGVYAPHRLEVGLTLRFPSLAKYPDFLLSVSNEKIFGTDGLIYKAGMEVYVQNFLALRGGYFYSPFAEGGRLGAGLMLNAFRLDYAFVPGDIDLNGTSHQVSISLGF